MLERGLLRGLALLLILSVGNSAQAAQPNPERDWASPTGRYLVQFSSPPVARFAGDERPDGTRLKATSPAVTGQRRLNVASPAVKTYRSVLESERAEWLQRAAQELGRALQPTAELDLTAHGIVVSLSPAEAQKLAQLPGVRAVLPDRIFRMETDAGPEWVGAPPVWQGQNGHGPNLGEGVVVGVLDGGVNWDHPAFADPAPDGYDHSNPKGRRFGLCSSAQVNCNDKLIGVYEFTADDQQGRDVDGHGSHVASTAVGNVRTQEIEAITTTLALNVSGVAPHANLISYRVCREDDPETTSFEGCNFTAIGEALDQAVSDGVDVINFSISGDPETSPWEETISSQMLSVRLAGIPVVTSVGNSGPRPGTAKNSPWMITVAAATHDRQFVNRLTSMMGGATPPPPDLDGVGITGGFGPAPIVHARDFGNALCGAGDPELNPTCEEHTGSSNPFEPGTFNGEIVVCDRGTYGRVEKGFNLRASGAGGYVLANTEAQGESIVADDHCLPALHLGREDGDRLRDWLEDGTGHQGVISGQFSDVDPRYGDQVAAFSSRGPANLAQGVLKPDLAAPGVNILAADFNDDQARFLSGTSMSSPHVAGAVALLLAQDPELRPDQIHSILMTTALADDIVDESNQGPLGARNLLDAGAGRLQVDAAARAGLYLPIGFSDFDDANPDLGGNPENLNLPGLVDETCDRACIFSRTVTDLAGGGTWRVEVDSDSSAEVSVVPSSFTLEANGSQNLGITIEPMLGGRSEGAIILVPEDPDVAPARLPFSVAAVPGNLPTTVKLSTATDRGSAFVDISPLRVGLPDAEFRVLGLGLRQTREQTLPQDPTRLTPYGGTTGTFFTTVELDDLGALVAETVPLNNGDLDLFVGRENGTPDGPQEEEELCRSTSPDASERCELLDLPAGTYWILVQNWASSQSGSMDAVRIAYAAVSETDASLLATGPGSLDIDEAFDVRLIWDEGRMRSGQTWTGLLLPRSVAGTRDHRIGPIWLELSYRRETSGTAGDPDLDRPAYALTAGEAARFTLAPKEGHGRLFIDVPEEVQSLTVTAETGQDAELRIVREPFVFADAAVPMVSGEPVATASGPGGSHVLEIDAPEAGRYYLVPVNQGLQSVEVAVSAELDHGENTLRPVQGLYFNPARNGAGFNLNTTGDQLIIEWYTYLEDGTPTWYLAQGPFPVQGNSWDADLLFFSWNGAAARPVSVGKASLVLLSETDLVFSFRVNGLSGTEPYTAIVPEPGCAAQGAPAEQTGLWFLPESPGFGYSVLSLGDTEIHINYLFDGQGFPRWVLGQDTLSDPAGVLPVSQFTGFCPTCPFVPVGSQVVGQNAFSFEGNGGSVETTVDFLGPVAGQWSEGGSWSNLTPAFDCSSVDRR